MVRFKDLIETTIRFNNAKDYDGFGSNYVILYNKDDEYVIKGKTHGIISHALKHIDEFRADTLRKIVTQARNIINDSSENIYVKPIRSKEIISMGIKNSKKYIDDFGVILNTLDAIQDKMQVGEILMGWEKKISEGPLTKLENIFSNILGNIISKSVPLDKAEKGDTVHFRGKKKVTTSENKQTFYLDFKENIFIIKNKRKISTAFKPKIGLWNYINSEIFDFDDKIINKLKEIKI